MQAVLQAAGHRGQPPGQVPLLRGLRPLAGGRGAGGRGGGAPAQHLTGHCLHYCHHYCHHHCHHHCRQTPAECDDVPARGWQFKASVTHWRADPELRASPVSSLASAASLGCPALTVSTQDQGRASILGTYTPTQHLSMGRPVYQSGRSHLVQYWFILLMC